MCTFSYLYLVYEKRLLLTHTVRNRLHLTHTYLLISLLKYLSSYQVSVVPSAAALIIKALKEPPRDRKKVYMITLTLIILGGSEVGNMSPAK